MDMTTRFLKVCAEELKKRNIGAGQFLEEPPVDFWDSLYEELQDEWAGAIDLEMYWELHRDELAPLLEQRLDELRDHYEIADISSQQEPPLLFTVKKAPPKHLRPVEGAPKKASDVDPANADTVEIDDSVIFETGTDIFDSALLKEGSAGGALSGEEPTAPMGPEMISVMLQDLEKRLTKTIEDRMECAVETRLRDFLQSKYGAVGSEDLDEPPFPPREGKKLLGKKKDIRGSIDANLWNLFQEECKKYNGNVSKTLDTILWRYFGKPKLSFEED